MRQRNRPLLFKLRYVFSHLAFYVLPIAAGCSSDFTNHPFSTYSYVFKLGGPKEIGDWGLSRRDYQSINDSIYALFTIEISESHDGNARRSQDASDQIIAIYHKLNSGWPELTLRVAKSEEHSEDLALQMSHKECIESLIFNLYYNCSTNASNYPIDPRLREMFYGPLKPDRFNAPPDRIRIWNEDERWLRLDEAPPSFKTDSERYHVNCS